MILSWLVDPCKQQVLGLHLQGLENFQVKSEMVNLLHFINVCLSYRVNCRPHYYTNQYDAKQQDPRWTDLDFEDFLHALALLLVMEVYEIHGSCRSSYWFAEMNDLFIS